jgi:fatty acid-binding protein DegV
LTVSIVTDSAAALPVELAEQYGVTVVPMWLTINGPAGAGGRPFARGSLVAEEQVTTSAHARRVRGCGEGRAPSE